MSLLDLEVTDALCAQSGHLVKRLFDKYPAAAPTPSIEAAGGRVRSGPQVGQLVRARPLTSQANSSMIISK